jgi:hypothetical protein
LDAGHGFGSLKIMTFKKSSWNPTFIQCDVIKNSRYILYQWIL